MDRVVHMMKWEWWWWKCCGYCSREKGRKESARKRLSAMILLGKLSIQRGRDSHTLSKRVRKREAHSYTKSYPFIPVPWNLFIETSLHVYIWMTSPIEIYTPYSQSNHFRPAYIRYVCIHSMCMCYRIIQQRLAHAVHSYVRLNVDRVFCHLSSHNPRLMPDQLRCRRWRPVEQSISNPKKWLNLS